MLFSVPALLALAGVAGLALFPPEAGALAAPLLGPDRAALWFLLICALLVQFPPLFRHLNASRDAATWALLCVFFILFHLADRAGPREGWMITFPFAAGEPVGVSYAARVVVIGALLSISLWLRRGAGERAVLVALALVGIFGLGMFHLLSGFYKVGATQTLDPTPMATLLVQIVSYGALALCCRAATEHERVRTLVLRALPLLLLLVASRHQFAPIPAPPEDE